MMPHQKMNFVSVQFGSLQPPANHLGHLGTPALMTVKMALSVAIGCLNNRLCDIVQQDRKF